MALIRLKYRASFSCTTYGRNIEDLKAQIKEIEKSEKVENVRFFKFTSKGAPYWGCMKEINA